MKEWLEKADWTPSMVHIEVPLRMKGGISIRRYAAKERRAGLCASDKTGASDR